MLLDRAAFLKPAPRRYDEFEVPGFGGVRIQSITEKERYQFEATFIKDDGGFDKQKAGLAKARFVVLCLVDLEGLRILADSDVSAIYNNMDAAVVDFIYERCKKHCNLEDTTEKKFDSLPAGPAVASP